MGSRRGGGDIFSNVKPGMDDPSSLSKNTRTAPANNLSGVNHSVVSKIRAQPMPSSRAVGYIANQPTQS